MRPCSDIVRSGLYREANMLYCNVISILYCLAYKWLVIQNKTVYLQNLWNILFVNPINSFEYSIDFGLECEYAIHLKLDLDSHSTKFARIPFLSDFCTESDLQHCNTLFFINGTYILYLDNLTTKLFFWYSFIRFLCTSVTLAIANAQNFRQRFQKEPLGALLIKSISGCDAYRQ
jgi:hypothetical protein